MVKIEVPEETEPFVQENEIKIEDISNNSKRKSSEGEDSNEDQSSSKKIKITEEDLEQMKDMTPQQKKYVEGLLGKIDKYAGYLKALIEMDERLEESKKELKSAYQKVLINDIQNIGQL